MVARLGMRRVAYDWRAQHVPEFEEEILAYKRHGLEYFAFWSWHDAMEPLIRRHGIHPQIWVMPPNPDGGTQQEKLAAAIAQLKPVIEKTQSLGCRLGLYNHGGWGGEPDNLVQLCVAALQQLNADHVGIVYNFHHGHEHMADFRSSFAAMQPYLLCLNVNGMAHVEVVRSGKEKILPVGSGQHEQALLQVVRDARYSGPIGILDHRNEQDAERSLKQNLHGLQRLTGSAREFDVAVWSNDELPGDDSELVVDRGEGKGYVDRSISRVSRPSLTVHLATGEQESPRPAVVICPGGGLTRVVIDKEGNDFARLMNKHGVTAFVLKFRTLDQNGLQDAKADLKRAMQLIRRHAATWNVDPQRVGVFGFSAGGYLAASLAVDSDPETRPDFVGMAYPLISLQTDIAGTRYQKLLLGEGVTAATIDRHSNERHVTADTPPVFLCHAADDPAHRLLQSQQFADACREAGVSVTTYFRDSGGHGFGIRQLGTPMDAWPQAFQAWLKQQQIIDGE